MNKKFSTLVAGLLLAGGVFTANAQADSPLMPRAAAFVGADVTELTAGSGVGSYKSNGFYQLNVDGATTVLAMVWDQTLGSNGKYKLMLRDLADESTPLDNTLWSISASWDQTSGAVNYVFVNKATLLPLQVAVPEDTGVTPIPAAVATVEGSVTNWVWNTNVKALVDAEFRSSINPSEVVYLTLNADGETVEVTRQDADVAAPGSLALKPVEAGRVILTAAQINSKLNNATGENATRFDFVFDPEVKNPVAEDAKNIMSELAWVAEGRVFKLATAADVSAGAATNVGELIQKGTDAEQYQIPDFSELAPTPATLPIDEDFVQLVSYKEWKQKQIQPSYNPAVLMVDTAYFDSAMNDKYNLKLAAKKLEKKAAIYDYITGASLTGTTAYETFQDQTLFKFVYEPTFDRVLIQAKQITKVSKADLNSNTVDKFWAYKTVDASSIANDGFVAATTPDLVTDFDAFDPIENNLVKLVYLTPTHSELTVDVPDVNDVTAAENGYCGALTAIKLDGTKNFGQWTFANISSNYYYIQNAKTVATPLIPVGGWAYQDLTATSASDTRADGNVVYSSEQFKTMPSAQWYISGKGGYYTIYNRESGKPWSTTYWYAVKDAEGKDIPNVYTNYGTFGDYGIGNPVKDTIRLTQVPADVYKEKLNGYLNISQEVAKADTSVFTFKYVTPLEGVNLGMIMKSDSSLAMANGEAMNFKLERVSKDNAKYGFENQNDMANKLERANYYIYLDEVSSNSSENTGYHERMYVVLEGGQYRLANMLVYDNEDGTTSLRANNPRFDRAKFFVKEIGEADKNYVLVDVDQVLAPTTGQGTDANGVRMAMDQTSLLMRANGLPSVAENVYTNSLLNLVKAAAGNYVSTIAYGDTVKVFSNDYPEVVMYENGNMLAMSSLEAGREYNTALFVDTAYVRDNTARPQYMFVLRPVFDPNCNFPNHAHHAVEGDYLVHMQDSVAQDVNKYTWDNKKFARLGFVSARHEGDTLLIKNSMFTGNNAQISSDKAATYAGKDTIDLANNAKDQYCTFALRYTDTNRDAFYLETLYKKGTPATKYENETPDTKGWVRWHNGVPVVVNDLSQAGKFNFETVSENPTANDEVSVSSVVVTAAEGKVIIKGAEGKKVVISNVLGQNIANTVITSSEATIAAPAGIVVVAVEGEAAVKAIVK